MPSSGGGIDLEVSVSLYRDSRRLQYVVDGTWHEIPEHDDYIPQLAFLLPVAYACGTFRYDVPFGAVDRRGMHLDVPACSFAYAPRESGPTLMLHSDSKHGFRCVDNAMSLTLVRTSYHPNRYSDLGRHTFRFSIAVLSPGQDNPIREAARYDRPLEVVPAKATAGDLPLSQCLLALENPDVALSAIKAGEAGGKSLVVWLYNTLGEPGVETVQLPQKATSAYLVDLLERSLPDTGQVKLDGRTLLVSLGPYATASVCIILGDKE